MIQWLFFIGFPVIIFLCYLFNKFKHNGNAKVEIVGVGLIGYIMGGYIFF